MAAKKSVKDAIVEKKDPAIAAIISFVCMILWAPAVGYFYIDDFKKGAEYLVAAWALAGIVVVGYLVAGMVTGVTLCCFPVFLVPLVFNLLIVWDVYLEAKGEPTKLPKF
jgi:hypothetical protein